MRLTMRMTIVAGALAVGGLLAAAGLTHAGCGGGGGSWGTRTYGRPAAYSGGGCGCSVMGMGGMSMGGMAMPQATMPAMNMGVVPATAAPAATAPAAAAGHYYTCPMHPSVASATPGACPYCHMALSYR
ncbi:MAG TPA: heavy metal-binding domain-containing protein [Isosphaeraceae bacterium]